METNQQLPVVSKQVFEIPIEQIFPDPTQPRKTMEEIQDMADSIKGAGNKIIQPIALRPFEKGYQIIFGERRYEGARLAGLKTVPSLIHENVSNEEALEMQLLENLQRKDIHPMQQAIGFRRLADERNMNVLEISQRLGKSPYFVRQQLRLNDLLPKWQAIFLKNGISLSTALEICILTEGAQKHLYDNEVSKEDEKAPNPKIFINNHVFSRYKGSLSTACFNLNDAELDQKAGSCSSCPMNSALNSLFPWDEAHPTCNNVPCFKNKINLHLQREIKRAKEDPTIVLVYDTYSIPESIEKIKEKGTEVLKMGYGDECKAIDPPEIPVWESFEKQQKQFKKPIKQIKDDFKKAQDQYLEDRRIFEENLATGKIRNAFVVDSTSEKYLGKYIYIELTPKIKSKSSKKAIDEGKATVEDYNNEIKRLKDRHNRLIVLSQETIHERITKTIKDDKLLNVIPTKITATDTALINFILIQSIGYPVPNDVKKLLKSPTLWNPKDRNQYCEALKGISKSLVAYLARKIVMEKFGNNLPDTKGGFMVRMMAEMLGTIPIQQIETEENEKLKKKLANNNRAIGIAEEMRKDLIEAKKKSKTTTKATTKNAA